MSEPTKDFMDAQVGDLVTWGGLKTPVKVERISTIDNGSGVSRRNLVLSGHREVCASTGCCANVATFSILERDGKPYRGETGHEFKVGDVVEFQYRDITPRWDYARDLYNDERDDLRILRGVVVECMDGGQGPVASVEYTDVDGTRNRRWLFPLPGHPEYALNRVGWPEFISAGPVPATEEEPAEVEDDEDEYEDEEDEAYDSDESDDEEEEAEENPFAAQRFRVGDKVRFELAKDYRLYGGPVPRWNFDQDNGATGTFGEGAVSWVSTSGESFEFKFERPDGRTIEWQCNYADLQEDMTPVAPGWSLPAEGQYTMSDANAAVEAGAKKYDAGKLRLDLIPAIALKAFAWPWTYGASKYGDNNWKQGGLKFSRLIAALERHLNDFKRGLNYDAASGSHLLAQVAWYCAAIIWYQMTGRADELGLDDRDPVFDTYLPTHVDPTEPYADGKPLFKKGDGK